MTNIILVKDINAKGHEIEPILLGIGKPKEPIRIQSKSKSLTESTNNYGPEEREDSEKALKHAILGDDYHQDLERVHSYIKPKFEHNTPASARDSLIHDLLKPGKPSGNTVTNVMNIIHDASFDRPNGDSVKSFLNHKWGDFLHQHAKVEQKITNPEDAYYTPDQLAQTPKNFKYEPLRLLKHATGHYFENHPTEGLRYLGKSVPSLEKSTHFKSRQRNDYLNLDNDLSNHYSKYPSEDVKHYTLDSYGINKHLYGIIDSDTSYDNLQDKNMQIKNISNHLNNYIQHPTHFKDFNVYTGVSNLNDIRNGNHFTENGDRIYKTPAFTSTTLSKTTAEVFAGGGKYDPESKKHVSDVLKIAVPGGYSHGAFIKPYSEHKYEREYLLDKDHTFIVKPTPRYYTSKASVYREWNASIHPRDVYDKNWNDISESSKIGLSLDPNASKVVLNNASNDLRSTVRAAAAKHPNIDQSDLSRLSNDEVSHVREAAYMNPSAPEHMLRTAFSDKDSAALKGIAKRENLSEADKLHLSKSQWPTVNAELSKRHDLNDEHINNLINEGSDETLYALARNSSLKPKHFESIINQNHMNHDLLSTLAENPSLSTEQLKTLSNHKDTFVRHQARENPSAWKIG